MIVKKNREKITKIFHNVYIRKKGVIMAFFISLCILSIYKVYWGIDGYNISILGGSLEKQDNGNVRGQTYFNIYNTSNQMRKVQLKMRGRILVHIILQELLATREFHIENIYIYKINGEDVEGIEINSQGQMEIPANTYYSLIVEGVGREGKQGDNSRFAPQIIIYDLRQRVLICFSIVLICIGIIRDKRKNSELKRQKTKRLKSYKFVK